MKRILFSALAGCLLLASLAACGGDASSTASSSVSTPDSAPASQPAPVPASASAEASAPSGAASSIASSPAASVPSGEAMDLSPSLEAIKAAAGITDSIDVMELDLRAGGIDTANVVGFAGAESTTASENGGIVVVVQTAPGTADTVKADFEKFRDSRLDDRYAEFAQAMENTKEARIVSGGAGGDLVVYAVSATGDWAALDAAIEAVLSA